MASDYYKVTAGPVHVVLGNGDTHTFATNDLVAPDSEYYPPLAAIPNMLIDSGTPYTPTFTPPAPAVRTVLVTSSVTAPASPITDDLWYDTTSKTLKRWNGASWDSETGPAIVPAWAATTAYKAGQAVTDPSGTLVTAKADFTSGSSYSATNWNTPGSAAYDGTHVPVESFGTVDPSGATDSTAAFVAAAASGKKLAIKNGNYVLKQTFAPKNDIRTGRDVLLIFDNAGTYTAQHDAAGATTGNVVLFDTKNLNNAKVGSLTVYAGQPGTPLANTVCFGGSTETASVPPNPNNIFDACQAWQGTWAIFATDDGVSAVGSLAGAEFRSFISHCVNGVFLGTQSSDDICFTGATRIVGVTGYGIRKVGGSGFHADDVYISVAGTTATHVSVEKGSAHFGHLFLESNDANVAAGGLVLNGASSYPAQVTIGTYHHNLTNGSKLIRILGLTDRLTIGNMPSRDWNGARTSTKILSVEYASAAAQASTASIGYGGTDDGTIVAFSFATSNAVANANLTNVIDLYTSAGRVQYRATVKSDGKPQAATMLNGWASAGAPWLTAGYYRDFDGDTHLVGLINPGTTTAGTSLLSLPQGFGVKGGGRVAYWQNGGAARVDVIGDTVQITGGSGSINLEGINFPTDGIN